MNINLPSAELSKKQFEKISQLIYQLCGIKLGPGKEGLVKSRLVKRLRTLGMRSFDQYLSLIESEGAGQELAAMVDLLTTNKTSFFRERQHFDYLSQQILPSLTAGPRRIRIWSAGCSSGQEPYSLAIVLREQIQDIDCWDARILATDISARMLARAREAIYEEEAVRDVAPALLQKYFVCVRSRHPRAYRVNDDLRAMVKLAQLNLMGEWPMKGPFDLIFCRNVMIYFDKPTQQALIDRFWQLLAWGGHLFVGHSESLVASAHRFHYVQPAVYRKQD